MNIISLTRQLALAVVAISIFEGCSDSNGDDSTRMAIQQLAFTGCKTNGTDAGAAKAALPQGETLTYNGTDKGTLHICHNDMYINCASDKVDTKASISEGTIVVTETENSADANCVCLSDIEYELGPLKEGKSYHLVLKRGVAGMGAHQIAATDFVYSKSLKGSIAIAQ